MHRTALLLLPLLAACATGKVSVGDDTAAAADTGADTDDTDTAADTDDTDSGTDTDDTAPPASAWAGLWEGTVTLAVLGPDGEPMELCRGDATVAVEDDGTFDGDGLCETDIGPEDIAVAFAGRVDDEGAVSGEALLTLMEGEVPYDLVGVTEPGGLSFGWEGTIRAPEGEEIPLTGAFSG